MTTAVVQDARFHRHDTGAHPESAARLVSIEQAFARRNSLQGVLSLTPREATREELGQAHHADHVQRVISACENHEPALDPDTVIGPDSLVPALLSAGSALTALDAMFAGQADNALVVSRPPGHHATFRRPMGFCFFNNVAVAARYAQRVHGVEKVLIVDWDVHHGNGTQDIFYQDPTVYYLSLHQARHYPWTGESNENGEGRGLGFTKNIPVRARTPASDYLTVFRGAIQTITQRFEPDLVLISAGFDAHRDDPLGSLMLEDQDFGVMTETLMEVAQQFSHGRLVSLLEGGYNVETLGDTVASHLEHLKGV